MKKRTKVLGVFGGVVALFLLFLLIQLIPVDRANPMANVEPQWDTDHTRELAKAACFDCHSNETTWPWYAKIAPVSWLTAHDVNEGREYLNFSEWGSRRMETHEIAEVIDEGEMPPWYYVLVHPDAKLSDAEKQQLIDGLNVTFAQTGSTTGVAGD